MKTKDVRLALGLLAQVQLSLLLTQSFQQSQYPLHTLQTAL